MFLICSYYNDDDPEVTNRSMYTHIYARSGKRCPSSLRHNGFVSQWPNIGAKYPNFKTNSSII